MVISHFPWEIVMLEKYFIRPTTVDHIQESWIAAAVEQYVSLKFPFSASVISW